MMSGLDSVIFGCAAIVGRSRRAMSSAAWELRAANVAAEMGAEVGADATRSVAVLLGRVCRCRMR